VRRLLDFDQLDVISDLIVAATQAHEETMKRSPVMKLMI
jgi:hypothetical protein